MGNLTLASIKMSNSLGSACPPPPPTLGLNIDRCIIGCLSNEDGNDSGNVKKNNRLSRQNYNFACAICFLYTSLLSLYDLKLFNFVFCGGHDDKVFFLFLNLDIGSWEFSSRRVACIWQSKRVRIINRLIKREFIFQATFSWP